MDILISGGRVIDPGSYDGPGDILITAGRIAAVTPAAAPGCAGEGVNRFPFRGQGD